MKCCIALNCCGVKAGKRHFTTDCHSRPQVKDIGFEADDGHEDHELDGGDGKVYDCHKQQVGDVESMVDGNFPFQTLFEKGDLNIKSQIPCCSWVMIYQRAISNQIIFICQIYQHRRDRIETFTAAHIGSRITWKSSIGLLGSPQCIQSPWRK